MAKGHDGLINTVILQQACQQVYYCMKLSTSKKETNQKEIEVNLISLQGIFSLRSYRGKVINTNSLIIFMSH